MKKIFVFFVLLAVLFSTCEASASVSSDESSSESSSTTEDSEPSGDDSEVAEGDSIGAAPPNPLLLGGPYAGMEQTIASISNQIHALEISNWGGFGSSAAGSTPTKNTPMDDILTKLVGLLQAKPVQPRSSGCAEILWRMGLFRKFVSPQTFTSAMKDWQAKCWNGQWNGPQQWKGYTRRNTNCKKMIQKAQEKVMSKSEAMQLSSRLARICGARMKFVEEIKKHTKKPKPVVSKKFTYIGCYIDRNKRALKVMLGRRMNLHECHKAAYRKGLKYFGRQWKTHECWGSNSKNYRRYGSGKVIKSSSYKKHTCHQQSGGGMMGGEWTNAVYKNHRVKKQRKRKHRPRKRSHKRYKFKGCFKDKRKRAMSKMLGHSMSFKDCQRVSENKGYKYFGRQWRTRECWGGNSSSYKRYGSVRKIRSRRFKLHSCHKQKSGHWIGGEWSLAVYSNRHARRRRKHRPRRSHKRFTFIGCYKDKHRKRAMHKVLARHLNVKACQRLSERKGYKYFGRQWRTHECWGGNSSNFSRHGTVRRSRHRSYKKHTCHKQRDGGWIGGEWSIAAYKNRNVRGRRRHRKKGFIGCYKDKNKRAMHKVLARNLGVKACQRLARKKRYKYFGRQWRTRECWGGNSSSYKRYGSVRKIRSRRFTRHTCHRDKKGGWIGGEWSLAVYHV